MAGKQIAPYLSLHTHGKGEMVAEFVVVVFLVCVVWTMQRTIIVCRFIQTFGHVLFVLESVWLTDMQTILFPIVSIHKRRQPKYCEEYSHSFHVSKTMEYVKIAGRVCFCSEWLMVFCVCDFFMLLFTLLDLSAQNPLHSLGWLTTNVCISRSLVLAVNIRTTGYLCLANFDSSNIVRVGRFTLKKRRKMCRNRALSENVELLNAVCNSTSRFVLKLLLFLNWKNKQKAKNKWFP